MTPLNYYFIIIIFKTTNRFNLPSKLPKKVNVPPNNKNTLHKIINFLKN
jgi:hypothetical protein